MAYYMIYLRDDGKWSAHMGDKDKEAIDYEKDDLVNGSAGYKSKDVKIVKFARMPNHNQVIAKLDELNGG